MMERIRISPVTPQRRWSGRSTAKKSLAFFVLIVGACLHANPATALEAMDDSEMGAVTGQRGILASFQYYYNSSPAESDPGAPLSICDTPNGGSSLANMNCRFGLQLKNRESEWLVFKNGHASIDLRRLAIDASLLGDSHGGSATYHGYFNEDKFTDQDGSTCLLPSGDCSGAAASGLAEMPGLRLSYPEGGADGIEFNDVRFGLYFEGLAVEPNALVPSGNGWEGNNNGSFMGLNIADNNGHQAGIAFGGDFYLYGY